MRVSPAVRTVIDAAWARGLRPPPLLSVAEWAEQKRVIGSPSPEPGPWRNARTPYLAGIMDVLSPSHPARIIALMKGSQVGGTEVGLNWLGYKIDLAPSSILAVLPSQQVAKEWSSIRLASLIENSPCLAGKLLEARKRDSGNTTFLKRINGGRGVIKIGWSSSAKVLRSTPAEDVLLEEVDGFEGDTQGEGDPVALLERRFTNFPRGKMFLVSTPTERSTSRIEREFNKGDRRLYFMPCPECGHFQRFRFVNLRWAKGEPGSVAYHCVACEHPIPEYQKTGLLSNGLWIATATAPAIAEAGFTREQLETDLQPILIEMEQARRVSFHLSALYSPAGWYSWRQLAEEWEAAQQNVGLLKVITMTVLAETWRDRGESPDWERLAARSEDYPLGIVPAGVLFLTAGVDVQKNRLELEILGWGRNKRSWSIDYHTLLGDTETDEPWKMLDEVLARDWPRAEGGTLPIHVMGVDSGFRSQKVYDFAGRHARAAHGPSGTRITAVRTVVPTKGGASWDRLISNISSYDAARKRSDLRIVEIGTASAKQELFDSLRLPRPGEGEVYPSGFCHFPKYEPGYFQGLCSESRVIRASGKPEWIRDPAIRNEPLDVRVINRACAELLGIGRITEAQWKIIEERLAEQARQAKKHAADPKPADPEPAPAANPDPFLKDERRSPSWFGDRRGWL